VAVIGFAVVNSCVWRLLRKLLSLRRWSIRCVRMYILLPLKYEVVKRAVATPTLLRRNPLFLGSLVCPYIVLFCPVLSAACLRGGGGT
jgi:hypothetical protein